MELNETLVDVMFKTMRMNLKTNVSGDIIEFKLYLTDSKSLMTFRVRKNTFRNFISWINDIDKEV